MDTCTLVALPTLSAATTIIYVILIENFNEWQKKQHARTIIGHVLYKP